MKLGVKIQRNACVMTYPFKDYFKNFEKIKIVRKIFGRETNEVIRKLKVEFIGWGGYMLVSDIDGHLIVSANYLKKGDIIDIYLDVIHELAHVKQFMKGKKLFDERFSYTNRPTEIEAYRYAVSEARRLGLDDKRICEYLKTEWMSVEDFKRLTKTLNIKFIQKKS